MRVASVAAAAFLLCTATACGGEDAAATDAPSSTPRTSTPTPTTETTEVNQHAQFGNQVSVTDDAGVKQMTFTVTGIETRESCPGPWGETYPMKAARFLVADVRVTTTNNLDRELGDNWSPYHDVSVMGPDGVADNNAGDTVQSGNCYPDDQLPLFDGLRPGMTYEAKMTLETDEESGSLIVRPTGRSGIVWDF